MERDYNQDGYKNSQKGNLKKIDFSVVEFGEFYDGNGNVSTELFSSTAKNIASEFSNKETKGVSSRQIRRVFDEVKRFERKLEAGNSWESQVPYIKMIESKVKYTVARAKTNKAHSEYYEKLSKFISYGLRKINSEKDYHVFVSLFEAVYGYYYENAPDLNEKKKEKN